MKIAITHSRFSLVGGAEKYIYFLLDLLLRGGHEIHYYCHYREDYRHPNLHFHHVPMIRGIRFLKAIGFALALESKICHRDYDIVHGFFKTYKQDIYTDGSGLVEVYHQYVLSQKQGVDRFLRDYSLYYQMDRFLEKLRFKKGNYRKIICMSRFVQDQIQGKYGVPDDRITVLYNGMDCEFFHPRNVEAHRKEVRKELGLAEGDLVFLLIGNDYIRKNVATALKAFARLSPSSHVKLLITGRDKNQGDYETLAKGLGIASQVLFAGSRRDIHRIHSASDVFLLPTHYDVFGMVVLEAMATGIPVLVSQTAGAAEIFEEKKEGMILQDPASEEELAGKIEVFLDSPTRRDMGDRARVRALDFSWEVHFDKLMKIYRDIGREKREENK